jgi:hypothetical protein
METSKQLRLFGLYLSQGSPYGLQSTVIPLLFRQWGRSYDANAMAHLTFLPWAMKPLVAPYLETASMSSVSTALLLSGITQLLIYHAMLQQSSQQIIALLLISNMFTALYDILVDKLAIIHRSESNLDFANVFQVVGYKLGSLMSGALTLYAVAHYFSGNTAYYTIAPLTSAAVMLGMAVWTHISTLSAAGSSSRSTTKSAPADSGEMARKVHRQTYNAIWKHFKANKAIYALVLTYKAGETIGDALFKTFLRDSGFDLKLLSTSNIINEFVSIAGSMAMMGKPKQQRSAQTDMAQLQWFILLNVIPQCLRAFIVCNKSVQRFLPVAGITLVENFIGGAVTVACFNFMFSNVLPGIEGTHYAVYASLEALGKILTGAAANFAVSQAGFKATFLTAIALSVVPLLLCRLQAVQRTRATEAASKLF